jgi:flagellar motor switch protein FliM
MSEAEREESILSRAELDAILEGVAESRTAGRGAPFRADRDALQTSALVRALREFAEEQGRALSALHQRSLEFSLMSWEPLGLAEFADSLLPEDRIVLLELEPGRVLGCLLLGRPLFYGLLGLAFGTPAGLPRFPIPQRAYTRIEGRFLLRVAGELAAQLESTLSRRQPSAVRAVEVVEPRLLPRQSGERFRMASFDVSGLGDTCRLRLVLPEGLLERSNDGVSADPASAWSPVRERMLRMPLRLCVEAGNVELPLRQLASLQVGDVLPLEAADGGGLLVRVGNEAKFRAERGSVGQRLAIQLLERL